LVAVFVSAAVTCFAALFLGQAALRLVGAREWNWLAPAVGLAATLLVATPTNHVPGRALTVAIVLALATIAAAVWCLRSPPHRPPLGDLLAALPVAVLVVVPFLAANRGGILGVTVNNDMAVHLVFVEDFISSAATAITPLPKDYPLGPHASAALLAKGLGIHSDLAFSGWTMAIPVINAWTALAVVRRGSWFGKAVIATVVGLPFLVAAYYGQGSFKEVAQTGFVLAVALSLSGCGPRLGRSRWVPLALLVGGVISVYSLTGLPWILAMLGLWLAGLLAIEAWRRKLREVPGVVRRELPALGIGLAVLVVALLPQAERMWQFISLRDASTGIAVTDIGNLVGPLSGWESLGIWGVADYRLPSPAQFDGGVWSILVVALILFGSYWAFRRGRWLLPLAAGASVLIWAVSEGSQSPYVSAKALVIASPLLLMVAMLPLVDREPSQGPDQGRRRWLWLLVPLLALVLLFQVGRSDLRALRFSPVGPTDHARQLQSFRPLLDGRPALYLGGDEFAVWELSGTPIRPVAVANYSQVPLRPRKGWEYGQAFDFDLLPASVLNEYEWFIAPRDAAGSEPPPQLHLVHSTDDFQLYRRVGQVRERSILSEDEWPGSFLRCDTPAGRAIVAAGGVAAVRRAPIVAPLPEAAPGGTVTTAVTLSPGTWELESPYTSPLPVEVTAPGLRTTVPANLEQPGPRLSLGHVTVDRRRKVPVSLRLQDTWLAPDTERADFKFLVATPAKRDVRVVPIARACGKYVDWYRSAS
jgi:hypothetical protein